MILLRISRSYIPKYIARYLTRPWEKTLCCGRKGTETENMDIIIDHCHNVTQQTVHKMKHETMKHEIFFLIKNSEGAA